MSFRSRVYQVVMAIPEGLVLSYGDVAALAGSPRAARQVGWALAALRGTPELELVPWQRVILSSGHIAFRGDPVRGPLQQELLEAEGVHFVAKDRVDMTRCRWRATVEELPPPSTT